MSICFSLHSALPTEQTRQKIAQALEKYGEILSFFWISNVSDADEFNREDDSEFSFVPKSRFIIQWNKERSELMKLIPVIFYEIFGSESILVRDNNYEIIPPP